jgi:hypothetical protein
MTTGTKNAMETTARAMMLALMETATKRARARVARGMETATKRAMVRVAKAMAMATRVMGN